MVASVNGKFECVKLLIEGGADPNLGDDFQNANRTAMERGLHSLDGNFINLTSSHKCYCID